MTFGVAKGTVTIMRLKKFCFSL